MSSSDYGLTFRTQFKDDYGDLHAGVYNGEGYSRFERNDRKAFVIRGTVRPAPRTRTVRGLRITGFYDADAPVGDGERRRGAIDVAFEHKYLNTAFMYLSTSDRDLPTEEVVDGRGFSLWATPRTTNGWEALLRYDRLEPDLDEDDRKSRAIAGIAYWLPTKGAQAAFLLDFETVDYDHYTPARPTERRVALHVLVNF
jgi:hypothetical protein